MIYVIPIPKRYSKSNNATIYRFSTSKEFHMRSIVRVSNFVVTLIVLFALSAVGQASARNNLDAPIPPNVDVSQRVGNESEEAIAVNPTNPDNIVIFTNIAEGKNGMLLAVTFDGGQTWNMKV